MYSSADMVSSSASHSVSAEAGDSEDFLDEEVEEFDDVDSCEDDLREIITYGKLFLLPRPEPVVATLLAARHNCCRKGSCIDASLLSSETEPVSPLCVHQRHLL